MKIEVLGSSSKGNCYLLKTNNQIIIIECGVSYKEILQGLDFNLSEVVGVLCTHSHKDHSKSVKDLINAGIDLYALKETTQAIGLEGHRVINVEPLKQFEVGDFKILPFPIEHDVLGLGFLIQYRPTGEKLLFITDSYYCKYKFKDISYLLIECNYIKETLDQNIEDGYIDERMKSRLLQSHFSLENVKEFLKANDLKDCRRILLLHLSDTNSSAPRMIKEIEELTGIETSVATAGVEISLDLYPY